MNQGADKPGAFFQGLLPWLLFVFSALAVAFPVVNTDIWWHLAAGREIFQTQSVPVVDRFSLSTYGKPWIDVHWLFQFAVFLLWKLGGLPAIVVGKSLLFASAVIVLFKASLSTSIHARSLAVVILALIVLAGFEYVYSRPVVFSLMYMALFLYFMAGYTKHPKWRNLAPLVVVEVIWANTQPLFPLGVVIVGCFFAGEALGLVMRRLEIGGFGDRTSLKSIVSLGLLLLLLVVSSMLTPYGVDGIAIPFKLFARIGSHSGDLFSLNVSENIPPWLLGRTNVKSMLVFCSVLLASAASFLPGIRRVSLSRLFLIVAMLVPALAANRNLLLFYWVAGFVIVSNLAETLHNDGHAENGGFLRGLVKRPAFALGALAVLAPFLALMSASRDSLWEPAPFRIPRKAADVVERLNLRGNIFNSVRYGGYLIWRFFPDRKPFMDGRLVLRTAGEFARYLDVVDHPERFDAFSVKYGLELAILPVNQPNRYARLVQTLYFDPGWSLIYTDGTQTLFVRCAKNLKAVDLSDRAVVEQITSHLSERYADDGAQLRQALVNLGLLLNQVRRYELAAEILRKTDGQQAKELLAGSLYLGGDGRAAQDVCRGIMKNHPGDLVCLGLLARMALESADFRRAMEFAKLLLEQDPFNADARRILRQIGQRCASIPVEHSGG